MKFEIERRKFRTKSLRFWKPNEGEHVILIDLGKEPRIRQQNFDRGKRTFADFEIETLNERGELERFYWSIPIARAEKLNGDQIVYFWEGSQRGIQLKQIADEYGYQSHILKVEVERDKNNKLNTKYRITHSESCPCLEKVRSREDSEDGVIELLKQRIREQN